MTLKWGVISTANIALTQFIPAIARANGELVAIASRGPKVHAIAKGLNVKRAYESYEELLLDDELEAVYIPLPNDLHLEWVLKAAEAGKHILCEKPIALTKEQFVEMVQACEKHNVILMEAFMYQFHPQYETVKKILQQGTIGDVKLFHSSHSFLLEDRLTNIRMDLSKGGGATWDVGCYSLHAMQNLINEEIETIYATSHLDKNSGVDVTTSIVATFSNGVQGLMDCSFDMTERNEITIVGSMGSVHLQNAFRPDRVGHIGEIVIETANEKRIIQETGDIYRLEIEFFEQAMKNRSLLINQHALTRRNIDLITAVHKSAAIQQVVVVKEQ